MFDYQPIMWVDGHLRLLDQRRLPHEVIYLDYWDVDAVADAIRAMVVRGAPAIGITAAYGMALAACQASSGSISHAFDALERAARCLRQTRPTAVNLSWALDRVLGKARVAKALDAETLCTVVLEEAHRILEEERRSNLRMGEYALELVPDGARILHHCNTGPLATGGYGTALRVAIAAHQAGKHIHVYVDETRPRLQGARLTAWELQQHGVPHTIIVDGAAAHIMRTVGIDLCVVGCDRVAANGDTANKIGTYQLALAAYAHGIPFYVVGPTSSIDLNVPSGDLIEIEMRPSEEVTHVLGRRIAPEGSVAANPAFDVTPARYITAIVTERGIVRPPFSENLVRAMDSMNAPST